MAIKRAAAFNLISASYVPVLHQRYGGAKVILSKTNHTRSRLNPA